MRDLILAMYAAPLLVAAAWDLATFRIPNTLTIIYLALFPVAALLAPGPVDWLWHLAAFGLVFVVGLVLFSFRLFGGGDIKLLIVTGLWLGWGNLMDLMGWVSIAGGAVALLAIAEFSPIGQWLLARLHLPRAVIKPIEPGDDSAQTPHRHVSFLSRYIPDGLISFLSRHIPYGLGICVGGLMMASKLPLL